jgi:hypothetical protein
LWRGRNVNRAIDIEDLQKMAISRLQRIVDDFIDGGINLRPGNCSFSVPLKGNELWLIAVLLRPRRQGVMRTA